MFIKQRALTLLVAAVGSVAYCVIWCLSLCLRHRYRLHMNDHSNPGGNVGFRVVMGILIFMSLVGGVGFAMLGAWPVFAYFGLDIILIYVAFRASYRSGRLHEIVRLTSSELLIERVQPSG